MLTWRTFLFFPNQYKVYPCPCWSPLKGYVIPVTLEVPSCKILAQSMKNSLQKTQPDRQNDDLMKSDLYDLVIKPQPVPKKPHILQPSSSWWSPFPLKLMFTTSLSSTHWDFIPEDFISLCIPTWQRHVSICYASLLPALSLRSGSHDTEETI